MCLCIGGITSILNGLPIGVVREEIQCNRGLDIMEDILVGLHREYIMTSPWSSRRGRSHSQAGVHPKLLTRFSPEILLFLKSLTQDFNRNYYIIRC